MEDIVERLRNVSKVELHEPLCMEAANKIERLREALQKIAAVEDEYINPPTTPSEANLWCILDSCVRVAEKALGKE